MSDYATELCAMVDAATPGPWVQTTAFGEQSDNGPSIKNADNFDWVATVQVSNVSEWRPNARLISQAPDLARKLADAVEVLERAKHELDQWVYADGSGVYRVERAERLIDACLARITEDSDE